MTDNLSYRSRSLASYYSRFSSRATAAATATTIASTAKATAEATKVSLTSIEEEYGTKIEVRKTELKREMVKAEAEVLKAVSNNLNERLSYDHPRFDSMPASHDPSPQLREYLADQACQPKAQVINPKLLCDRSIMENWRESSNTRIDPLPSD